jgi:hypothetical protein
MRDERTAIPPRPKGQSFSREIPMNEETLEQIQTKIAFLERAASELSEVVFSSTGKFRPWKPSSRKFPSG